MEAVNGVAEGPPPPSPLTGCYLLLVLGEPHTINHKDIILHRLAKGLLSWNVNDCLVDLEKELAIVTEQGLEGEEARYGERLIQFASENLVTEILIHPSVSTLAQCVRNLLSSFTRHRHIIHAGYTIAANGSWILQDGTFSFPDFAEAFQEIDVQRVIRAYENGISIDIHCSSEGEWAKLPKEAYTRGCKVRVNPDDVLDSGSPAISSFIQYISPFLVPAELESTLESSDVVGNIRFSRPTLYVFPGGQGDAALFGINGFNMLVDGGFSRKACFWDFVRHLDRLDAVMLTRLNNSNSSGIGAVLRRKAQNAVYPQIGHFFCNVQSRKVNLSPDGDKDKDPLLVNLLDEGQDLISNLRRLELNPQLCYRDSEPINLYHKVGHGTLDMYVLNPAKDSREVREFLLRWNSNDHKLFANHKFSRECMLPLQNIVSICALLVWRPANPNDTITRILFPGSAPQSKIFEGLDKVKNLECIKHTVCTEKTLSPPSKLKTKENILDKIMPKEAKKIKIKQEKIMEDSLTNGDADKKVKKSGSIESDKSDKLKKVPDNKAKSKGEVNGVKTKVKVDKKSSPPTPKKTVDVKKVESDKDANNQRIRSRMSPSATPAKSTKDANNRKVLESKTKTKKETKEPKPVEKKEEVKKVERKPISRRPKTEPKYPQSPVKRAVNGICKPDSLSRKGRLDKEATTDSSTVSTPSADQDSLLKKDLSKLTPEEIQELKLAELKEEQEAIKELEAVFRKGDDASEETSDLRKIKDVSIDDKTEPEEYLIVEKEVTHEDVKEEETVKLAKDSEESEKKKDGEQEEESGIGEQETDVEDIRNGAKEDELKDEKIESGATTTAPTLPEDEKMPLNEVKEDQIEEKHVKEDTKEKETKEEIPVITLVTKTAESMAKIPSVVGIRLDKETRIRDIVKTPDEVADLPVHEEVEPEFVETKTTPEVEEEGLGRRKRSISGAQKESPKEKEEEETKKELEETSKEILEREDISKSPTPIEGTSPKPIEGKEEEVPQVDMSKTPSPTQELQVDQEKHLQESHEPIDDEKDAKKSRSPSPTKTVPKDTEPDKKASIGVKNELDSLKDSEHQKFVETDRTASIADLHEKESGIPSPTSKDLKDDLEPTKTERIDAQNERKASLVAVDMIISPPKAVEDEIETDKTDKKSSLVSLDKDKSKSPELEELPETEAQKESEKASSRKNSVADSKVLDAEKSLSPLETSRKTSKADIESPKADIESPKDARKASIIASDETKSKSPSPTPIDQGKASEDLPKDDKRASMASSEEERSKIPTPTSIETELDQKSADKTSEESPKDDKRPSIASLHGDVSKSPSPTPTKTELDEKLSEKPSEVTPRDDKRASIASLGAEKSKSPSPTPIESELDQESSKKPSEEVPKDDKRTSIVSLGVEELKSPSPTPIEPKVDLELSRKLSEQLPEDDKQVQGIASSGAEKSKTPSPTPVESNLDKDLSDEPPKESPKDDKRTSIASLGMEKSKSSSPTPIESGLDQETSEAPKDDKRASVASLGMEKSKSPSPTLIESQLDQNFSEKSSGEILKEDKQPSIEVLHGDVSKSPLPAPTRTALDQELSGKPSEVSPKDDKRLSIASLGTEKSKSPSPTPIESDLDQKLSGKPFEEDTKDDRRPSIASSHGEKSKSPSPTPTKIDLEQALSGKPSEVFPKDDKRPSIAGSHGDISKTASPTPTKTELHQELSEKPSGGSPKDDKRASIASSGMEKSKSPSPTPMESELDQKTSGKPSEQIPDNDKRPSIASLHGDISKSPSPTPTKTELDQGLPGKTLEVSPKDDKRASIASLGVEESKSPSPTPIETDLDQKLSGKPSEESPKQDKRLSIASLDVEKSKSSSPTPIETDSDKKLPEKPSEEGPKDGKRLSIVSLEVEKSKSPSPISNECELDRKLSGKPSEDGPKDEEKASIASSEAEKSKSSSPTPIESKPSDRDDVEERIEAPKLTESDKKSRLEDSEKDKSKSPSPTPIEAKPTEQIELRKLGDGDEKVSLVDLEKEKSRSPSPTQIDRKPSHVTVEKEIQKLTEGDKTTAIVDMDKDKSTSSSPTPMESNLAQELKEVSEKHSEELRDDKKSRSPSPSSIESRVGVEHVETPSEHIEAPKAIFDAHKPPEDSKDKSKSPSPTPTLDSLEVGGKIEALKESKSGEVKLEVEKSKSPSPTPMETSKIVSEEKEELEHSKSDRKPSLADLEKEKSRSPSPKTIKTKLDPKLEVSASKTDSEAQKHDQSDRRTSLVELEKDKSKSPSPTPIEEKLGEKDPSKIADEEMNIQKEVKPESLCEAEEEKSKSPSPTQLATDQKVSIDETAKIESKPTGDVQDEKLERKASLIDLKKDVLKSPATTPIEKDLIDKEKVEEASKIGSEKIEDLKGEKLDRKGSLVDPEKDKSPTPLETNLATDQKGKVEETSKIVTDQIEAVQIEDSERKESLENSEDKVVIGTDVGTLQKEVVRETSKIETEEPEALKDEKSEREASVIEVEKDKSKSASPTKILDVKEEEKAEKVSKIEEGRIEVLEEGKSEQKVEKHIDTKLDKENKETPRKPLEDGSPKIESPEDSKTSRKTSVVDLQVEKSKSPSPTPLETKLDTKIEVPAEKTSKIDSEQKTPKDTDLGKSPSPPQTESKLVTDKTDGFKKIEDQKDSKTERKASIVDLEKSTSPTPSETKLVAGKVLEEKIEEPVVVKMDGKASKVDSEKEESESPSSTPSEPKLSTDKVEISGKLSAEESVKIEAQKDDNAERKASIVDSEKEKSKTPSPTSSEPKLDTEKIEASGKLSEDESGKIEAQKVAKTERKASIVELEKDESKGSCEKAPEELLGEKIEDPKDSKSKSPSPTPVDVKLDSIEDAKQGRKSSIVDFDKEKSKIPSPTPKMADDIHQKSPEVGIEVPKESEASQKTDKEGLDEEKSESTSQKEVEAKLELKQEEISAKPSEDSGTDRKDSLVASKEDTSRSTSPIESVTSKSPAPIKIESKLSTKGEDEPQKAPSEAPKGEKVDKISSSVATIVKEVGLSTSDVGKKSPSPTQSDTQLKENNKEESRRASEASTKGTEASTKGTEAHEDVASQKKTEGSEIDSFVTSSEIEAQKDSKGDKKSSLIPTDDESLKDPSSQHLVGDIEAQKDSETPRKASLVTSDGIVTKTPSPTPMESEAIPKEEVVPQESESGGKTSPNEEKSKEFVIQKDIFGSSNVENSKIPSPKEACALETTKTSSPVPKDDKVEPRDVREKEKSKSPSPIPNEISENILEGETDKFEAPEDTKVGTKASLEDSSEKIDAPKDAKTGRKSSIIDLETGKSKSPTPEPIGSKLGSDEVETSEKILDARKEQIEAQKDTKTVGKADIGDLDEAKSKSPTPSESQTRDKVETTEKVLDAEKEPKIDNGKVEKSETLLEKESGKTEASKEEGKKDSEKERTSPLDTDRVENLLDHSEIGGQKELEKSSKNNEISESPSPTSKEAPKIGKTDRKASLVGSDTEKSESPSPSSVESKIGVPSDAKIAENDLGSPETKTDEKMVDKVPSRKSSVIDKGETVDSNKNQEKSGEVESAKLAREELSKGVKGEVVEVKKSGELSSEPPKGQAKDINLNQEFHLSDFLSREIKHSSEVDSNKISLEFDEKKPVEEVVEKGMVEPKEKKEDEEFIKTEHIKIDLTDKPEHAEAVLLKSTPESPVINMIPSLPPLPSDFDKTELGRKSPKEREEDVIKIVASVATVLKSDAPLEEFEGKLPITKNTPFGSFTTELRETHITTCDSPGTVHRMLVTASSEDGGEETEICPAGTITFSRSSESSGRSSPDNISRTQTSSIVDSVKEVEEGGVSQILSEALKEISKDTEELIEKVLDCIPSKDNKITEQAKPKDSLTSRLEDQAAHLINTYTDELEGTLKDSEEKIAKGGEFLKERKESIENGIKCTLEGVGHTVKQCASSITSIVSEEIDSLVGTSGSDLALGKPETCDISKGDVHLDVESSQGKKLSISDVEISIDDKTAQGDFGTHITSRTDPMSTSFYGQLPDEEASPSHLHDLTKARFSGVDPMTSSFFGELPTEDDPISSWGKPLGLPSPAPPNEKGTPKKERKVPSSVMAKNRINDDRARSESPSKNKKKVSPVYVDLTYVPHHGNSNYANVEFFKRVRARYYVFSGIEPSREVYNALLEAKQTWEDVDSEVTIIPTYDTDVLGYWVAENEELLAKYKIDLSPSASRCTINLQDHETSCSAYRLEF